MFSKAKAYHAKIICMNSHQIENLLKNVAKHLPIIRPIKEFVHLNLLSQYQHLHFWEALKEVSAELDARPFLDLTYYQQLLEKKQIDEAKLNQILLSEFGHQSEVDRIKDKYFRTPITFDHHDSRIGRFQFAWNEISQAPISELSDGLLIKWLAMFLDQGICQWSMPSANNLSFYQTIRQLLSQTFFCPTPFNGQNIEQLMPENAFEAIKDHLNFLCPNSELHEEYLKETILGLRGWAGLITSLEKDQTLLDHPRDIKLSDFLAVKLTLQRAWIQHYNPKVVSPKFFPFSSHTPNPYLENESFNFFKCLQQAYEKTVHEKQLIKIVKSQKLSSQHPRFQAIFCMDDREGFLRQNLEQQSGDIMTYGTAGHFGIEFLFQASNANFARKQCPLPVSPKLMIKERSVKKKNTSDNLKNALALFKALFIPSQFYPLEIVHISRDASPVPLDFTQTNEKLPNGYILSEMTLLAFNQLKAIGLLKDFSPLVFVIGHHSQSANNPFFNAYGCGACSGRSGEINARIFCQILNRTDVREDLMKNFQIDIPEETYFVAGVHDTCRDNVTLYINGYMSKANEVMLNEFNVFLHEALKKNALRRIIPLEPEGCVTNADHSLKILRRRSDSLFEPRPELGHTNVAFSIVGRRELTRGIDLEGLAFLQSYDSKIDPDGVILQNILSAVIPVTSGIGLDYYFSRTDNYRFGAGSKLPQNVVGLLGLSHGTESDLLVGLPLQMIDQHHPVRLLVLVEQTAELALKAIRSHPQVNQIVSNEWVRYMSIDPITGEMYLYHDNHMHPYHVTGSLDA
jgi:uncharacterized protein YbcC (UPF0753/DUF2309 family)